MDSFKIESFQSADAMRKPLSEIDFGLSNDRWIEHDSHIFGTLYYRGIFKWIQFVEAVLPSEEHLNFERLHLAPLEGCRIYTQMNTGDWRWDTQNQLPAGATVVHVIFASPMTHLTDVPADQHGCLLYRTIVDIRWDICRTPKMSSWMLVGLIPCPQKDANIIDEACDSAVGTSLSQLKHLDITGPSLKWECADGFQRWWYPLLAACVVDYPLQGMVAQVSYGSYLMREIPKGVRMGHSIFRPLDYSRDQDIYLELLEDNNIDSLHTLGAHPNRNQFWWYPLCNVCRLWQPDELHQLRQGLDKDLLHQLLRNLKRDR